MGTVYAKTSSKFSGYGSSVTPNEDMGSGERKSGLVKIGFVGLGEMRLSLVGLALIIIIIMYIYHALINALSAHMIHINLNMIFYTHVDHSPTKTIYIKYYTKNKNALQTYTHTRTHTFTRTHNDCSRN